MEYSNENEVEIDLLKTLYYACKRWRNIAVVAIILAFMIGGLKLSLDLITLSDEEEMEKVKIKYDAMMTAYEEKGAEIQRGIATASNELELQKAYNEDSMLMKVNPYSEWNGKIDFYVATDYQIMPGSSVQNENPAYRIVAAYNDYASSGEFYQSLKDSLSFALTDIKYLKEIVKVSADTSRYSLTLDVVADTEQHCNEIMTIAQRLIVSRETDIANQIDIHSITPATTKAYSIMNIDRETFQSAQKNKVTELEYSIPSLKNDYLNWEDEAKTLEIPIMDTKSAIKDGLKYFLLAGLITGLVMGAFFCLTYILTNKVQGAESIPPYVHIIAELPDKKCKKKNAIDKLFMNWFGIIMQHEEEPARLAAAAEHISQLTNRSVENGQKAVSTVAFISDVNTTELHSLVTELKKPAAGEYEPIAAGNIITSMEASHIASEADAVILVVKQGVSLKKTMNTMLDQLNAYQKPILGAMVLDVDAR